MKIIKNSLIYSLLLIMAQMTFATAEVGRKTPSLNGIDSAGPYYNPASKSYFEMFRFQEHISVKPQWHTAKSFAEEKFFKNKQGRLAIISDLATHQFLAQTFLAQDYWIGLQYLCGSKSLKWVDGTDASQSNFSAWSTQWSNSHIRCGGKGYMGVRYTTQTATKALRWRATGPVKFYQMYLVEYPTGKK